MGSCVTGRRPHIVCRAVRPDEWRPRSSGFVAYAWKLWRQYSDRLARKTFRYSIIYLPNPAVGARGIYTQIVTALGATPRFYRATLIPPATDLLAAETAERGKTVPGCAGGPTMLTTGAGRPTPYGLGRSLRSLHGGNSRFPRGPPSLWSARGGSQCAAPAQVGRGDQNQLDCSRNRCTAAAFSSSASQ